MTESPKPESEQRTEPKVIVEIAPQTLPIHRISREVEQRIRDGASYIGIDLSEEDLRTVNREQVGGAIAADLAKLPLRDNSVDQMWMLNVIGDLRILPEKTADGTEIYNLGVRRFFEEIHRVLKEGKSVYIGEYIVPIRDVDWVPDEEYGGLGFDKEVYTGEQFQRFFQDHQMTHLFTALKHGNDFFKNPKPFFMVLTKRPQARQDTSNTTR